LAEGLKPWQVLTEGEKIRRRELVRDSKSALEQGLTLEQYVAKREQTVVHAQRPGSSPTELYEYYLSFGKDPANSRRARPPRHVMAWLVDRLGRSLQVSELHALGIDLFLHQQALDTTTPAGRQNSLLDRSSRVPAILQIDNGDQSTADRRSHGSSVGPA
jgi:hypothetical protein